MGNVFISMYQLLGPNEVHCWHQEVRSADLYCYLFHFSLNTFLTTVVIFKILSTLPFLVQILFSWVAVYSPKIDCCQIRGFQGKGLWWHKPMCTNISFDDILSLTRHHQLCTLLQTLAKMSRFEILSHKFCRRESIVCLNPFNKLHNLGVKVTKKQTWILTTFLILSMLHSYV